MKLSNDILFGKAAELISGADAIVIAAGAGLGVDSGLPDFRGNDGFWKAYPALAKAQIDFTEIANPRAFDKDTSLAWGFYGHRLELYRKTVPHTGFQVLKKWSTEVPLGARIFTSNVDGQFQKAGFDESMIHECHGSIHHLQCTDQCPSGVWNADSFLPDIDEENCKLLNAPPTCPICGKLARPNIVMFGDWNWESSRRENQRLQENKWFTNFASSLGNLVIVEMGAGTAIPSVRHFSQRISREYGARIVRINPRESQVPSSKDVGIPTGTLEALRGIDTALAKSRNSNSIGTFPSSDATDSETSPLNSAYKQFLETPVLMQVYAPTDESRGDAFEFHLDARPLVLLIEEAASGLHVYEFLTIQRPSDIFYYLWVQVTERATWLSTYVLNEHKVRDRFGFDKLESASLGLATFDSFFKFRGEDTETSYYQWLSFRGSLQWKQYFFSILKIVGLAQAALRSRNEFLLKEEIARIDSKSHHCDFTSGFRRQGFLKPRFEKGNDVPTELFNLIMAFARRPEISSVSIPHTDFKLWRALVAEQVKRAKVADPDSAKVFELNGPDGGIPYVNAGYERLDLEWGGDVHVPYEGACGSDLFVQPNWFQINVEKAQETRNFNEAVFGIWGDIGVKQCKYLMTHRLDLGELPSATRITYGDWAIYFPFTSTHPASFIPDLASYA
jgi:NAD-dependent SIR2 family protein deacetylase